MKYKVLLTPGQFHKVVDALIEHHLEHPEGQNLAMLVTKRMHVAFDDKEG